MFLLLACSFAIWSVMLAAIGMTTGATFVMHAANWAGIMTVVCGSAAVFVELRAPVRGRPITAPSDAARRGEAAQSLAS